MKNLTGVAATAYHAGVDQTEAVRLMDSPARRARVGPLERNHSTCGSSIG